MTFTADLTKWCRDTAPDGLRDTVRKTLMEIDARLMLRSPVGDPSTWKGPAPSGYAGGRFKGNWQYTTGSSASGEVDLIDPSGAVGSSRRQSGMMSSNMETVHWFTNNVPYAQRLEEGHSWRQAPHGIINRIELEFPAIVEMAKR